MVGASAREQLLTGQQVDELMKSPILSGEDSESHTLRQLLGEALLYYSQLNWPISAKDAVLADTTEMRDLLAHKTPVEDVYTTFKQRITQPHSNLAVH